MGKYDKVNGICDKCVIAKGIKLFKCKCGKETSNYCNGLSKCFDYCKEENICRICGEVIK